IFGRNRDFDHRFFVLIAVASDVADPFGVSNGMIGRESVLGSAEDPALGDANRSAGQDVGLVVDLHAVGVGHTVSAIAAVHGGGAAVFNGQRLEIDGSDRA